MLRAEIAAGSALGIKAKAVIDSGDLVTDDLVNEILVSRIRQPDCEPGMILDGYPRTVEQAHFLDTALKRCGFAEPVVVYFYVATDALVARMASRLICRKCGRTYNDLAVQPKVAGVCDGDGGELIRRADDREDVIRARLATYEDVTRPVLSHYPPGRYVEILGDETPGYVFEDLVAILGTMRTMSVWPREA